MKVQITPSKYNRIELVYLKNNNPLLNSVELDWPLSNLEVVKTRLIFNPDKLLTFRERKAVYDYYYSSSPEILDCLFCNNGFAYFTILGNFYKVKVRVVSQGFVIA